MKPKAYVSKSHFLFPISERFPTYILCIPKKLKYPLLLLQAYVKYINGYSI